MIEQLQVSAEDIDALTPNHLLIGEKFPNIQPGVFEDSCAGMYKHILETLDHRIPSKYSSKMERKKSKFTNW